MVDTIVVACKNKKCPNYNVPVQVLPALVTEELLEFCPKGTRVGDVYPHWTGVTCGGCGNQIYKSK